MIVDDDDIIQKRLDAGLCPRCSSDTLEVMLTGRKCRCCGIHIGNGKQPETTKEEDTGWAGSIH